jgi:hypothetical protein
MYRNSSCAICLRSLVILAVMAIVMVIAVPKLNKSDQLNKARLHAQEMDAVRAIEMIHAAQVQYFSRFGNYAPTLAELVTPANGRGRQAADLVPADLAQGIRRGYRFTLRGGPDGYVLSANPVAFGKTGRRMFFSDQTLIIRQSWGPAPATVHSDELR